MKKESKGLPRKNLNRQVHFWVDPALLERFQEAAAGRGESAPSAHRSAMKRYVDETALDGAAPLLETTLSLGNEVVHLRAFTRGAGEIIACLTGPLVERLTSAAGALALLDRRLANQESPPNGSMPSSDRNGTSGSRPGRP